MPNLSSLPKNKRNRAKEHQNRAKIGRDINVLTRGRVMIKIQVESSHDSTRLDL